MTSSAFPVNATSVAPFLSLYGALSAVGRSVVVLDSTMQPLACGTLQSTATSVTLAARLTSVMVGWVYLQQNAILPFSDTTISIVVQSSAPVPLAWSVVSSCDNPSTPFNPLQALSCDAFICPIGSLSSRHGPLMIPGQLHVITDSLLPVSGQYSIENLFCTSTTVWLARANVFLF